MVKCITLGKFDNKYKYMIYYILIMLPLDYFLGDIFPDEMKIKYLRKDSLPNTVFVYEIFKYFGIFIFGLIFVKIEYNNNHTIKQHPNIESNASKMEMELLYDQEKKYPTISVFSIVILISSYILELKLNELFCLFGLLGLDFWMTEIIFVIVINILLFKIKIYFHQKLAISIILIFSTFMKICSIIFIYKNDENRIFIKYSWLLYFGVIFFLLFFFLDAYLVCKMKWYFDFKFFSEKKLLTIFGICGSIIFFILSIISHFIKCHVDTFSSIVCTIYDAENSAKYFDNFKIYFKNIWKEDRTVFINCVYIFIILLKISLSALHYFFSFSIIKVLGPEYMVFSDSVLYFIIKIICLIYFIMMNTLKTDFIFDFLSQVFSILGTIIYLELIELNFCNLNHNLKKYINLRAKFDCLETMGDDIDEQSFEDII